MIALDGAAGEILFAALGLVGGSFATAASHRLPHDKPLAMDRSRCPACDHPLGAVDLIPVLSWATARGRCRYCGAPVSARYPAIELVTCVLFVGSWWLGHGDTILAALLALAALGLVVITVADLETGLIPDKALVAMAPLAVAWRWYMGGDWIDALAGALVGVGLLLALRAGFKALRGIDAMGLGDVKFVALAGFFVGIAGLAPFLVLGGVLGIVFGFLWRLAGRGATFPFGPALCVALAVALAWPGWFGNLLDP